MKKKKILHLITGLKIGGAEMMLLKTLPLLQEYFENEVCCIKGHGSIGKHLEQRGVLVHYLDLNTFNLPLVIIRFRKLIKNFKPDILATYLIHADLFGRIFGKIFGVKKIICNKRGFYLHLKFLKKLDYLTKFLVSNYIVQTEFAKNEFAKMLNMKPEEFSVIPNAINLNEFIFNIDKEKKKNELKIPKDNLNIVCVSNLKPRKGYKELLEAFEKTYVNFKNINLLVVGDGDQKDKYLRQIENYICKNNIFFLGRRADVKEILSISDIFVLATYSEGMSNAILEAMASKLAIITTNIEVNRELIQNNESGLLVPIKNSDALAERLKFLIENKEKRIYLGEKAYEKIVEKFEIKKVTELIKNNYEKIIYGR